MQQFNIGKDIVLDVDLDKIAGFQPVVDGLIRFAVKQILTNAHASITAEVEPDPDKRKEQSIAAAEKRLDAWYRGEYASGERGPKADPILAEMRLMARAELKANGAAWKLFKALRTGEQTKLLDKLVAKNETVYRPAAIAKLAIKPETVEDSDDIMSLFAPDGESSEDESGDDE